MVYYENIFNIKYVFIYTLFVKNKSCLILIFCIYILCKNNLIACKCLIVNINREWIH